ncbi:MAG: hypothetical protein ABH969_12065, partial [Pseudomonadota bacterium]
MALGIESEEVAKGLDGNDGAGEGIPLRHRLLKKSVQLIAVCQESTNFPIFPSSDPSGPKVAEGRF